jgi:hypothetical protein
VDDIFALRQENGRREKEMKRSFLFILAGAFLAVPMLAAAQQAQPSYKSAGAGGVPPIEQVTPPPGPLKPLQPALQEAKSVTVTGTVEAVKGKKGKVTGYTLKTDAETYTLEGKKVSWAMVGKKVEATGTVSTTKSGKNVLAVKQIKEVG